MPLGPTLQEAVITGIGADMPARLTARATKLASMTANELAVSDEVSRHSALLSALDVTTHMPTGSGIDTRLILPSNYEVEAELFYGPFMQLGTFMDIQDPVMRFVVDAVFDPLNLVLPGTMFLKTPTAKVAKLVTSALGTEAAAAARVGRGVRDFSQIMDSVQDAVKLAGAKADDLKAMREAALAGDGKAMQKIAQRVLASDPSKETGELLALMADKKNRKALSHLAKIADEFPTARPGQGFLNQDTLMGRLRYGHVNPPIRIEKPFATTRALMGIGYGDTILWSPVNNSFFRSKASNAMLATAPGFSGELARQAGRKGPIFGDTTASDLVDVAGHTPRAQNLRLNEQYMMAATSDPLPPLARELDLELATPDDIRTYLERALDRKVTDEDVEMYTDHALHRLATGTSAADDFQLKAFNESVERRMSEAEELLREGDMAAAIEKQGQSVDGWVDTHTSALRSIYRLRDPNYMFADPSGVGEAIQSLTSTTNMRTAQYTGGIRDMVDSFVTGRNAARGREYVAESLDWYLKHPEMFEEVGDIIRLKDRAEIEKIIEAGRESEKKLGRTGSGYDFMEDTLRRAEIDQIDLLEGLRGGYGADLSEALRSMKRLSDARSLELGKRGLISEQLVNYARRNVKRGPNYNKVLGENAPDLTVYLREELAKADDVAKAIEDAEGGATRGNKKALESVQKARRATEKQLLALHKRGIVEVSFDSLDNFNNGVASSQRAFVMSKFWEDTARGHQILDEKMLDSLLESGDITWAPEFLNSRGYATGVEKPEWLTKGGTPVALVPSRIGDRPPWEALGTTEAQLKKFYRPIEIDPGLAQYSPWAKTQADALRAEARVKGGVRRVRTAAEISKRPDLLERIFGTAKPRAGKKSLSQSEIRQVLETGHLPSGLNGRPRTIRRKIDEVMNEQSLLGAKALLRDAKGLATDKRKTVWVLKGMDGHFRDALQAFERDWSNPGKGFAQWFGKWNYAMKGLVLNLSFFHKNVITFAGLLANPTLTAKLLMNPRAQQLRQGLYARQALGAAGGAAVGYGFDEEEGAVWGSLTGLLYGTAMGAAKVGAKTFKEFALDPQFATTYRRAAEAGFTSYPTDRSIGFISKQFKKMSQNVKEKYGKGILSTWLDKAYDTQVAFEKDMWELSHNHHKLMAFHHYAGLVDKRLAAKGFVEGTPEYIQQARLWDREAMQVVNSAFGGHALARMWNNPEFQKRAQLFLMSPDWTVGNMLGAGNIMLGMDVKTQAAFGAAVGLAGDFVDAGFDVDEVDWTSAAGGAAVGPLLGMMSKRVMSRMMTKGDMARALSMRLYRNALVGGYLMMNLLNAMSTGHGIWDNPEGKKLAVAMPGGEYYVALGKPYLETLELASAIDREKFPITGLSRIVTKLNPSLRLVAELVSGTDGYGPIVRLSESPAENHWDYFTHSLGAFTPIVASRPLGTLYDIIEGKPGTRATQDPSAAISAAITGSAGFAISGKPHSERRQIDQALSAIGL